MKAFHVICGLPRSGSTLLCNVLAQNPAFHVLHTSPLPSLIDRLAAGLTDVPEVKGMLQRDQGKIDAQSFEAARALIRSFHGGDHICFDKNRLWSSAQFLLAELFPDAKIICLVRDLRAVFGSFEKHWRRNPLMQMPPGRTIRERMNNQFSPQGMIGDALAGIDDLVLTQTKAAIFVITEQLVENPGLQLQRIYDHLGLPVFEHDFENVKNTAIDPDWLYLGKFPHEGSGKVEPREDWQEFVPQRLAGEIMANHAAYNQTFGYV